MGREEQIINERVKKLDEIRKGDINPYPDKYDKKQTCLECVESKIKGKGKNCFLCS
jgi:lysyl-tRNA synthetase class II